MKRLFEPYLKLNYWVGTAKSAAAELLKLADASNKPLHVVTLTAEMLVHAADHPEIEAAIVAADFFVADTVSASMWLRMRGRAASRITGVDLAESLIAESSRPRVALLGGASPEIREKAADFIAARGGTVVASVSGPSIVTYEGEPDMTLCEQLQAIQPNIIFVAFGHGKQEWWISHAKKHLNYNPILIGVGGTLDVWGGLVPRAPKYMRAAGLEWLWRLFVQPKRFFRILTATIIFPYRALRDTLL